MPLPLIPVLVGGGAALYAWWKGSSAAEQANEVAQLAVKINTDFSLITNKVIPEQILADPTASSQIAAILSETRSLYTRFQETIKPYVSSEGGLSYENFRKAILNLTGHEALRSALYPIQLQVRDLARRVEQVCPPATCGKTATEEYGSDRPVSLWSILVYGGLAFGATYLAIQGYKAVKQNDAYPRNKLPRYAK